MANPIWFRVNVSCLWFFGAHRLVPTLGSFAAAPSAADEMREMRREGEMIVGHAVHS